VQVTGEVGYVHRATPWFDFYEATFVVPLLLDAVSRLDTQTIKAQPVGRARQILRVVVSGSTFSSQLGETASPLTSVTRAEHVPLVGPFEMVARGGRKSTSSRLDVALAIRLTRRG
jgi:hypothetical protein